MAYSRINIRTCSLVVVNVVADAAESIDEIEPCGRDMCGWRHKSRESIRAKNLMTYLDIVSISAQNKTLRYTLYTSRADLDRTYRGASTVEAKRCKRGFFEIRKYSTYGAGVPR